MLEKIAKLFPHISSRWYLTWSIFYTLILLGSIILPKSLLLDLIKVLSILGCLIYTCINFPSDRSLKLAMFTTLIADALLAFCDNLFYGVFIFFITQLLHHQRLTQNFRFTMTYGFIMLLSLFLIKTTPIHQYLEPLIALCIFYTGMILINISSSYKWWRQNPTNPHTLSALSGFILFLLCDSCVALAYFTTTGILPSQLEIVFNFLAWFFYYPSQILVSNSTKCATID